MELFLKENMKTIILIDGENLTYALRKYGNQLGGKGDREFLSRFDYAGMFREVFEDINIDEIIWFGCKNNGNCSI